MPGVDDGRATEETSHLQLLAHLEHSDPGICMQQRVLPAQHPPVQYCTVLYFTVLDPRGRHAALQNPPGPAAPPVGLQATLWMVEGLERYSHTYDKTHYNLQTFWEMVVFLLL